MSATTLALNSRWRQTDGGLSTVIAAKEIVGKPYVYHTTEGPGDDEWSVSLTARDVFLNDHTEVIT